MKRMYSAIAIASEYGLEQCRDDMYRETGVSK